jgi:hypothetical protein
MLKAILASVFMALLVVDTAGAQATGRKYMPDCAEDPAKATCACRKATGNYMVSKRGQNCCPFFGVCV